MGETVRLRSTTARIVGAAAMLVAVVGIGTLVASGDFDRLADYGPPLGLMALAGWAAFWSPYIDISDGGVEMHNVLRTVRVPWPAIEEVEGRYGLRLRTAYGKFDAWAAQPPGGRDRVNISESHAAEVVRRRLDELRRAGHLDQPRLEADRADVRWHVPELVVGATLSVALVVLAVVR